MKDLPIYPYLDEICQTLISSPSRFLVLTAETAAGKSSAMPIALLPYVSGKILMLEPRRIATLAIATRIASILGEGVGKTAGYRLHLDTKITNETRIEVITEAILTRMIQGDPSLSGISVVILDEFHERSVHSDLALAFLREIVTLRKDLFVLVMSATIDTSRIAAYLNASVFTVKGRQWPVTVFYKTFPTTRYGPSLEEKVARTIAEELESPGGNILAFLPGIAEIRRTRDILGSQNAEVLLLHSSIPFEDQRRVLEEKQEKRRVILSSSIAETSITVPGVTIVIDSGVSRLGRFDIPTGMYTLVTESESIFSADQRKGRAGRNEPGKCIRLWAEYDVRLSSTPPEITRIDIMPLVLECALWGVRSPTELSWLDMPNVGAWKKASELLVQMNALDESLYITPIGRAMTKLGVHPRIASIALAGNIDLAVRYSSYSENKSEHVKFRADLERRLRSLGEEKQNTGIHLQKTNSDLSLLCGYPDRIARHTGEGIYQFPSGRLASLPKTVRDSSAIHPLWIIATDVDAGEREGKIWSFEVIDEKEAEEWLFLHAKTESEVTFTNGKETGAGGIKKIEYVKYGKLVLSEKRLEAGSEDAGMAFCSYIRKTGFSSLPWSPSATSFLLRARFWYRQKNKDSETSPADESVLMNTLEEWLLPFIPIKNSITAESFLESLRYRFETSKIENDVPSQITVGGTISRPLLYEELVPGDGPFPVLEIKIQDLFGCRETPRVMGIPVLLRLLSPARRPLQITSDLESFWKNTWPEVRKEMKGRYPKHKWPENPLEKIT